MLSSTFLTLLVIPAIYAAVKRRGLDLSREPAIAELKKQPAE
jgi:hypothetical protein